MSAIRFPFFFSRPLALNLFTRMALKWKAINFSHSISCCSEVYITVCLIGYSALLRGLLMMMLINESDGSADPIWWTIQLVNKKRNNCIYRVISSFFFLLGLFLGFFRVLLYLSMASVQTRCWMMVVPSPSGLLLPLRFLLLLKQHVFQWMTHVVVDTPTRSSTFRSFTYQSCLSKNRFFFPPLYYISYSDYVEMFLLLSFPFFVFFFFYFFLNSGRWFADFFLFRRTKWNSNEYFIAFWIKDWSVFLCNSV